MVGGLPSNPVADRRATWAFRLFDSWLRSQLRSRYHVGLKDFSCDRTSRRCIVLQRTAAGSAITGIALRDGCMSQRVATTTRSFVTGADIGTVMEVTPETVPATSEPLADA